MNREESLIYKIDVYKIIENTRVEGTGNRFCIWVQGCKKHCSGCWAKETWEFGCGTKYTVDEMLEKILAQKGIEGVTFLGGEPFEQAKPLSILAEKIKKANLSVVCFTGYTIEHLKNCNNSDIDELSKHIDLLIDGGFEKEKFDLSRPWVGSSNQRYHFLTDVYSPEIINKYTNKIEARITKDGSLALNGMGDFERIKEQLKI